VPFFVDIRPDALNIDERAGEGRDHAAHEGDFRRALCGVCAEMDAFRDIAVANGLLLVEDAAQALLSTYRGKPAGTLR
jgi:dTDP-4-amino-4,6-dideoxygalactose transaminase